MSGKGPDKPIVEVSWREATVPPPKRAALLRLLFGDTEPEPEPETAP
jgi:hypothetical protein